MYFEQNKSDIQKNLDYSIEAGHHQIKILAFLRNNSSGFSRDFKASIATLKQDANIYLENNISNELCFFLNNNAEQSGYLFGFQANGPDISVRQLGVGVHSLALLFIEAKRLPPTSSQDYVKEGIGRFKEEKHGKQHNIAAMLGYVQKEDFSHWFGEVNSWIAALISDTSENPRWTQEDKIDKIHVADIGEYQSKHCRITKGPITLHHFWIDLRNPQSC
jgi:hypothetical protein